MTQAPRLEPGAAQLPPQEGAHALRDAGALREATRRLHRFGGDALVRDMRAIFVADVPERLAAARIGIETGNRRAVVHAAHSLKASCGQIGAATMQRLCADAERLAADGALDRVAPLLAAVAREFDVVRAWLAADAPAVPDS